MKQEEKDFLLQRYKENLGDLERYIEEFSVFLPLAVCTVNPIGIIVDINQATKDLTGYSETDIIGQEIEYLFEDKELTKKFFGQIFKKKLVENQEMVLCVQDKCKVPVNVSGAVRKDSQGNIIGCFLAISDITEIKKFQENLENKVKERTQELQEKIEELEKFHRLAVGRELRMIELKEEIKKLKEG